MKSWQDETDFVRLSEAVATLKAKVERLYHESRDDEASAAHDDLVACEWRLQQSERRAIK